jgi:Domain of Unknown Function with PDB structure (DUF3857)
MNNSLFCMEVRSVLRKRINAALLAGVLLLPAVAFADTPVWLRALAGAPARPYAADVDAVVLLDDQTTTVKENGEIIIHGRVAFRILRTEGRHFATHRVYYDSDSKVNYIYGWSITSKGQEYETKQTIEATASSFEVYSDVKMKAVQVSGADVGTVVGFEFEQKKRPYIFQDFWDLQGDVPVERSRYELHLASGWRFKTDWVNHEPQSPSEEGGALVWKFADIPRIEREPHRPPEEALAARMVVTFLSDKMPARSYRDWSEFGSWYTQLAAGVGDPTPALEQKVRDLAPASLPMLERIKALARFAQHDVRYVEIQIGIGGWRPHTAGDVFTHRYGDCKDKATMLRSMLAGIGVKSYYLLVHTQRGSYTKDSPPQARFDHMILAIALPEASFAKPLPAAYEHPKLGHLLIFDPTNEWVPFGQIPPYEQDNYGLLVGEQGGELINLPLSQPEANEVNRTARLRLLPDGTLQGQVEEVRTGYEAMWQRLRLQRNLTSAGDRLKMLERFLGASVANFKVDSFDIVNADDIDKDLIFRYTFTAEHYAKNAGPLLLLRPRVVGEMAGAWDASKPRHYAYEFEAPFLLSDTVEIALPDGFKVDELPDPAKAAFPFGEYTSKIENSGNLLKYDRRYRMNAILVPLDQTGDLKKLFSQITADERSTAVLKRAN